MYKYFFPLSQNDSGSFFILILVVFFHFFFLEEREAGEGDMHTFLGGNESYSSK